MIDISPRTRRLLALAMLKGVGSKSLQRVLCVPNFEQAPISGLWPYLLRNTSENFDKTAIGLAETEAQKQIDFAQKSHARIISSVDSDYPKLLGNTPDAPQFLFIKGNLAPSSARSIAIIGTRKPTDHGKVITRRVTGFFVDQGWSVVSGLAIGCDAIAHEAVLEGNGHTVAVMAHGLQTVAPARHKKLATCILEAGGALVSEYHFGQEPLPWNFVKRDRTQAGLAEGVVMVQSDLAGGSLHASRAAIDYKRWLAIPYPTRQDVSWQESKIQANLLLADGPST